MSEASAAQAASFSRPRVALIGTGGTIAMHGRHGFDWIEYGESGIFHPVEHLMQQIGALDLAIDVVPVPFRAIGSTGITPRDWLELARLIQRTAASDPTLAGFVVTHGTATLEETSWFLDLALALDVPIVVTGAQRPPNTMGSDAPANLRGAIAAAASSAARGLGTLVVMGGLVFAARDVTKAASFELNAFEAPFGPLGRIEADGMLTLRRLPYRAQSRPLAVDLAAASELPRVDIVISYAGADRTAIDALVAAGARGLVSAGLAPGRPADGERAALADASRRGVVVVQSTRAARASVPIQRHLEAAGVLAGGDLSPHKLRILLMLALLQTTERAEIQRIILNS